jgi:Flp pilus assembly protein TadD
MEAITELDLLLLDDPHNPGLANLKGAALGRSVSSMMH